MACARPCHYTCGDIDTEGVVMTVNSISRRTTVGLVGAAIAAPFVSRHGWAAGKSELVICSWGGSYQKALKKAFFDPFARETKINVVDTSAPEVARVKAQVDAKNVEWDVIEGGIRWYPILAGKELIQPLDLKRINTQDLLPDAVKSHGVAHVYVSNVIAMNSDKIKGEVPQGWADFWDIKKFPGPRALGADLTYKLEYALLADGVTPDKLYPIDVERAFKKLAEIKPHIKVWWKQGDQPIQLLSQAEVFLSEAWNGRVLAAQNSGLPIKLSWHQGSIAPSFFMIPTGAPHRDEAHEFLNFATRPQPQADVAVDLLYGPTNPKALPLIAEDVRRRLPTYPDNLKLQWPLNGDWLAQNFDALNDRWQKFLIAS
jgi:putative spermidine/putrescine transport system substrate-binding protein